MKTFILALMAATSSTMLGAQPNSFTGDWSGTINMNEKGKSKVVRIVIDSSRVTEYIDGNYDKNWLRTVRYTCSNNAINFLFAWMKQTNYSSVTETFIISAVDDNKLQFTWLRTCKVYSIKKGIPDDIWTVTGSGNLFRTSTNELAIK